MTRQSIALLALALFASCFVNHAQAQCATNFQKYLSAVPGLTITSQAIGALASSSEGSVFPSASDGVTFFAVSDAAFSAGLKGSNLTAAEIGDKAVSILLYSTILQGAFTGKALSAANSVQSALGSILGESLPLSFATSTGPSGSTVTVSGISGKATLPSQIPVCSSNVYIIDTLLLPAATLATVPSVLTAIAAATTNRSSVATASGPAFATAGHPNGAPGLAPAPAPAPLSAPMPGPRLGPGLAPGAGTLPGMAPMAFAPVPAMAVAMSPPLVAVTAAAPAASINSTVGLTPALLGLAPTAAPSSGAGVHAVASVASLMACSAAIALLAM